MSNNVIGILFVVALVWALSKAFSRKRPVVDSLPDQRAPEGPQGMYIDPTLLAELGRQQIQTLIDKQQQRAARGASRGTFGGAEESEPGPDELVN